VEKEKMPIWKKGEQYESLSWTVYDSALVAATDSSKTFFVDPVSSSKTDYQTNLRRSGQLMEGERFTVKGFAFWPKTDTTNNLALLLYGSVEFYFCRKPYQLLPLWCLGPGGGWGSTTTTAATTSLGWPGVPDVRNFYVLNPAIELSENENIRAEVKWPVLTGLTPSITCFLALHGTLYRAIQ
jgi:hypothetical protein